MKTVMIGEIEWQAEDNGNFYTWDEAMEYASTLGDGWRLPTIKELFSLIDYNEFDPACSKIKNFRPSYFWSGSSVVYHSDDAWGVNFAGGHVHSLTKGYCYYIRCVRDMKLKKKKNLMKCCPICGSKTFEKVTQNNGILGPGGRSWAIYYICSSCSVLFKDVEKFFKKQNDKQLKQLGGKRGIKDVHL